MHTVAIVNKNILSVTEKIKPGKVYKVYENFYNDRKELYKEFKGNKKSFIYVIVNKLNGKCYVGSTRSIKNRVVGHSDPAYIATQKGRPISSAILKYGLVNFAFIIIEEVDTNLYQIEERETYWIKHIKPEYNATKDAARNIGGSHSSETKLAISKKRSSGPIYIYNEFKQLLAIAPSLISIAVLLGNKSISISLKRVISGESLFRSSWYLYRIPLNEGEKPLMEVPSPDYAKLIDQMKSQKHIIKAVFVFKDGQFLCKYDGIMSAEKALKISHETIKMNIVNKTTYNGYRFSYHRIID
jgi:group I intron endonuclease